LKYGILKGESCLTGPDGGPGPRPQPAGPAGAEGRQGRGERRAGKSTPDLLYGDLGVSPLGKAKQRKLYAGWESSQQTHWGRRLQSALSGWSVPTKKCGYLEVNLSSLAKDPWPPVYMFGVPGQPANRLQSVLTACTWRHAGLHVSFAFSHTNAKFNGQKMS